jgi:hypothetical protein
VFFEVVPDAPADQWRDGPAGGFFRPRDVFFGSPVLGPILLAGVFLLAVRNVRRGRGDVRGAARFGTVILIVLATAWVLGGHHSFGQIPLQISLVLGGAGALALLYGMSYLAFEPLVRRKWPGRLTAWNRLLDGRVRDAMVGRDVLIGLAFGAASFALIRVGRIVADWVDLPRPPPLTGTGPFALAVPGPPSTLYLLLSYLLVPVVIPVLYLLLSFVCYLVLRREWVTWIGVFCAFVGMFASPLVAAFPDSCDWSLGWIGAYLVLSIVCLARFGLLAMAGNLFFAELTALAPLTADPSAWYAYQGLGMAAVMIGLAVYGFVTATRGRRLFREGFFGDE